ncbi:hypothetical protein TWF696_004848 [Orbilia brochopaga]|uniref:Uncharacterized protein n=1 Tax=Orbilia brochopaga TaxID=3140254 RepID=A0AAV9V1P3_9PEZI
MMNRGLRTLNAQHTPLYRSAFAFTNHQSAHPPRCIHMKHTSAASTSDASSATGSTNASTTAKATSAENFDNATKPKKHTVAEADEALRAAMGDIDGGGASSVEMEGGKFVGLRKGVKDNMFRVI